MKERLHDETMLEIFRNNPSCAIELLNNLLEDGERDRKKRDRKWSNSISFPRSTVRNFEHYCFFTSISKVWVLSSSKRKVNGIFSPS